mmetsp:Transcript_96722/g.273549  ORF Transcript_96722/g.273549 Transcript_96722/m.273549 type:complete len:264 (-) Transcript_96722:1246-2037(-)
MAPHVHQLRQDHLDEGHLRYRAQALDMLRDPLEVPAQRLLGLDLALDLLLRQRHGLQLRLRLRLAGPVGRQQLAPLFLRGLLRLQLLLGLEHTLEHAAYHIRVAIAEISLDQVPPRDVLFSALQQRAPLVLQRAPRVLKFECHAASLSGQRPEIRDLVRGEGKEPLQRLPDAVGCFPCRVPCGQVVAVAAVGHKPVALAEAEVCGLPNVTEVVEACIRNELVVVPDGQDQVREQVLCHVHHFELRLEEFGGHGAESVGAVRHA